MARKSDSKTQEKKVLVAAYMILAQILKAIYIRINKEWV